MGKENSNITFSAFLAISGLIAFDFVSADNERTHVYGIEENICRASQVLDIQFNVEFDINFK